MISYMILPMFLTMISYVKPMIVHIKTMICLGQKSKMPYIMRGVHRLYPEPCDRQCNAFPTKPVASREAHSCDDSIRPY